MRNLLISEFNLVKLFNREEGSVSSKDFQLLLWFLFFIISIILVGIAIYKKVKKQPIKL